MFYLQIFAFITAFVLIVGVVFMAAGGKLNKRYAGKLMSLRVILQLATILMLLGFSYFYS